MSESNVKVEEVTTEAEEVEEAPLSLDVVYAEVKDRLNVQLHQIDSLDAKCGTLLFLGSIVVGVGAAAQAALVGLTRSPLAAVVFTIPILCYFGLVFFALRGWVVRPYFRDPEPRPLRDHYLFRESEFTKRRVITHFISSYEWNTGVIKKKVRDLGLAILLFAAETASLAVVLVIRPWVA